MSAFLGEEVLKKDATKSEKELSQEQAEKESEPDSSRIRKKSASKHVSAASGAKWEQLQVLSQLLAAGHLTQTEFNMRKGQLIDEMTGTSISATKSAGGSLSIVSNPSRLPVPAPRVDLPTIVSRPPPDFATITAERATKYEFDLSSRAWKETPVLVKLDPVPFSKGALRLVYYLQEQSPKKKKREKPKPKIEEKGEEDNSKVSYVAKLSMDRRDNAKRDVYFRDVEMQTVAKYYSQKFNEHKPPKKVDFVKAWLLMLEERGVLCGVERYIEGEYRKHNNNWGFVSEEERNTPQAFSHFTYECSNHKLLICDIQGVSDCYTDPQIHSADSKGFGKGNLGQRGIDEFLRTHRCNTICRYLKLPPVNANYSEVGTRPGHQLMTFERIQVVTVGPFVDYADPLKSSAHSPLLARRRSEASPLCHGCCTIL